MSKTGFTGEPARPAPADPPAESPATPLSAALPVFLPAILRIWEAQQRIDQGGDPERALAMVRRHVDRALAELSDAGLELRSYEGEQYDPGMRAIVPTHFREDPDVASETVGKTGVPAVFYKGRLVAKSRAVILAPPVQDQAAADGAAGATPPEPEGQMAADPKSGMPDPEPAQSAPAEPGSGAQEKDQATADAPAEGDKRRTEGGE